MLILVLERVADMDVCVVRKGREIIEIAMLCGRDLTQVRKGNSRR
jgi:hypothetical protein